LKKKNTKPYDGIRVRIQVARAGIGSEYQSSSQLDPQLLYQGKQAEKCVLVYKGSRKNKKFCGPATKRGGGVRAWPLKKFPKKCGH